jgi:hypothetical protein
MELWTLKPHIFYCLASAGKLSHHRWLGMGRTGASGRCCTEAVGVRNWCSLMHRHSRTPHSVPARRIQPRSRRRHARERAARDPPGSEKRKQRDNPTDCRFLCARTSNLADVDAMK